MRITLNIYFFLFAGAKNSIPMGKVTCHNNHTVDITITNVDDLARWNESQWRLENNASCQPTFHLNNKTVIYDGLALPDCAFSSKQLPGSVKYILKISAKSTDPGGTGQLYVYEHLYYVSCEYFNQNKTVANFVPLKNREHNDSSMWEKNSKHLDQRVCFGGGWEGVRKRVFNFCTP